MKYKDNIKYLPYYERMFYHSNKKAEEEKLNYQIFVLKNIIEVETYKIIKKYCYNKK